MSLADTRVPAMVEADFSRPDWDAVRASDLDRWLSLVTRIATAAGERSSHCLASPRATGAASALGRGLAAGDPEAVARAAASLAGLGEGLTPAGDDYLVGVLHALWARRGAAARGLAGRVAAAAASRTTALSALWLAAAARGEAATAWRDLLAALASGGEDAVHATLVEVASTGHTSGAASLAGFAATLRALPG